MTRIFITLFIAISFLSQAQNQKDRSYYQLSVYTYKTAVQENALDNYLEQSFIPALRRMGIKNIGAFKPIANDTAAEKRLYVFVDCKNSMDALTLGKKLREDRAYQEKAAAFLNAPYDNAPFLRMETILMEAFTMAPRLTLPRLTGPKAERVYELRNYESATEKLYRSKVHMFNEGGEIALFDRLEFNGIFYGEVIAGASMPNFMYMTSFANMADRDAHWKAFGIDPEWKSLSAKPEYQHNVSRAEIILLRATPYSTF
jgi:hypothetical protein